jgi:DNA-directed RNA polymerase sigma subunit (sigma70/sigma32)
MKRISYASSLVQHVMDPTVAFTVPQHEPPAIEVLVNFGIFAGREATPAEIDRLAEWLLDEVGEVSIISEERHEIDAHVEASVHQVRIEVSADRVPADATERSAIQERILERAEHWTKACVADRHAEIAEGV